MLVWIGFLVFILIALILDLGVFNKSPHVISTKEASVWTIVWVVCALLFAGVVYLAFKNNWLNHEVKLTPEGAIVKFITGYLIELSLSVDNIFVIALIFSSFGIPRKYQHEVLFYGVLGAILFRAVMIVFGVTLINRFDWIIYVFGGFLIYTALKMLFRKEGTKDPRDSKLYKIISRIYPTKHEIENGKFFVKENGVRYISPLLIALVIIEFTDIFFAMDSIPAILAITPDPFIVFTSNILAIMGLRSMFFLISGMLEKFKYISYSLVVILAFVGIKMIISHHVDLPEWLSLAVITASLGVGIIASRFSKSAV